MWFFLVFPILTVSFSSQDYCAVSSRDQWLSKGLPFDEDAADECLDGRNNSCGMLTMENNVVEEKQLNTTYTFFGQHFQSLFVCENGLISFGDSNDFCVYPTDLKNSTAPLIVGFFGEDIKLHPNPTGPPSAYYSERSEYDMNGCFNASKRIVEKYLPMEFADELTKFDATHIFVSTWHGIQSGIGTVQIVVATQEGKNDTYALLIHNITNLSEEDKEQIGFAAGDESYSLSNIARDSNIGVPGVYAFRIDKENIEEACMGIRFGNNGETSGPIEVCYKGEWRSVCDDYWTDHDAKVACEQLGFSQFNYSAKATKRGVFEREFYKNADKSELYWLDDVQCRGNETSLFDCKHREKIGTHNCGRKERAGVKCIETEIRFADERKEIIEVRYNGSEWRSVCINHWTLNDVKVACRQLGIGTDGSHTTVHEREGKGEKYWLDFVNCHGDEESLFACHHLGLGEHKCDNGERAGVKC